jgi:hypothetical protein
MDNEITVDGVAVGPTEIITIGTMISALLVLVFHKDWGLAAHIQTLAAQALIVLPVVLGILRSFKHHLAVKVAVAKIAAQPTTPSTVVVNSTAPSGSTISTTFPSSSNVTTFTVGAPTPDPNLGADVGTVDVGSIPEDLPQ